jgi:hypothetical protein
VLEWALLDAVDHAVADAYTSFGQELPAVVQRTFGREEATRVRQPALAVVGEHSIAVFRERDNLLLAGLPDVESFELSDATHRFRCRTLARWRAALRPFSRATRF